jgi:hypothetical protein
MNSDRFIDKSLMPTEDEVYSSLGSEAKDAWAGLMSFAAENYDHAAEWNYGGKNYGWNVRYRKSGKTLFCMFPEKKALPSCLSLEKRRLKYIGTDVQSSAALSVQCLILQSSFMTEDGYG